MYGAFQGWASTISATGLIVQPEVQPELLQPEVNHGFGTLPNGSESTLVAFILFQEASVLSGFLLLLPRLLLTYTHILIVQLRRAISEIAEPTILAVLSPSVMFATNASHQVQEINEAAPVGVSVTFAVCKTPRPQGEEEGVGGKKREEEHGLSHQVALKAS